MDGAPLAIAGLPTGAAAGRADLCLASSWVEGELRALPPDSAALLDAVATEQAPAGDQVGPPEARIEPVALTGVQPDERGTVRDGHCCFGAVPGQREILLELRHDGAADAGAPLSWWRLEVRPFAVGANAIDLSLPADRAGLTVRLAAGGGLGHPRVTVLDADTGELLGLAWVPSSRVVTWPALPAREVVVVCPDTGGTATAAPLVTLLPGEQHTIDLRPLPRGGGTLRGHIAHTSAATTVALRREGVYAQTRPAKDNSYVFGNVPPGRYELWCRGAGGWSKQEVRVDPGTTVVDLDVP
ncbi:MAG: hypothetical protein HZB16_12720 [Armatimonadetes bacterium]|nr:hypothetical protein [Armatimonadota bacterium]